MMGRQTSWAAVVMVGAMLAGLLAVPPVSVAAGAPTVRSRCDATRCAQLVADSAPRHSLVRMASAIGSELPGRRWS
jgi:hypothetical protein